MEEEQDLVERSYLEIPDKLFSRRLARSVINASFLGAGIQLTGISVVTTYATVIFQNLFKNANEYQSAAYGACIMSSFKLLGAVVPLFCVNLLKRKPMLFGGFFVSVIGNIGMSLSFLLSGGVQTAIVITATALFVLGFEFGPGTI